MSRCGSRVAGGERASFLNSLPRNIITITTQHNTTKTHPWIDKIWEGGSQIGGYLDTREAKGASKTRDPRSVSKLRHTRPRQYGLGCGGASDAVTWIPVSVSEIHPDMSLEHPVTQNQPRTAAHMTDGIMNIL